MFHPPRWFIHTSEDRTNFDERWRLIWGNLVRKEVIIDQRHPKNSNCDEISKKQFEDNPKTNAFNMLCMQVVNHIWDC